MMVMIIINQDKIQLCGTYSSFETIKLDASRLIHSGIYLLVEILPFDLPVSLLSLKVSHMPSLWTLPSLISVFGITEID
jgi:hypothetical protein